VDRLAGDCGQAYRRVTTVLLQMQRDHRIHAGALIGVKVATSNKVLGQWPPLVASPRLEGGQELELID
jgi:hypothetical protein